MNKPNLFIIGAPKCGTTTLSNWLHQHPNVFMSKVKEPHYYASDLYKQLESGDYENYLSLFDGSKKCHQIIGEASTGYLYSRVAVEQILLDSPESKFIVCLRDPVSMAISLHRQRINDGLENIDDFQVAWSLQDKRCAGKMRVPFACPNPELLHYGNFCKLGEQVERLLRVVDREKVHFVLLDDLKENPRETFREILNFLELGWCDISEYLPRNEAFVRKNLFLHQLLARIYRVRRILRIPRLGTGFMALESKWNRRPISKKQIDGMVFYCLSEYFSQDARKLEKLIGRDLSGWPVFRFD